VSFAAGCWLDGEETGACACGAAGCWNNKLDGAMFFNLPEHRQPVRQQVLLAANRD
jgi:hypothetical protein